MPFPRIGDRTSDLFDEKDKAFRAPQHFLGDAPDQMMQ